MDYDNTNRGAAHAPFESQNLLLTGKLDKDGNNKQVAIIQDKDQQGRDVLVVFERVGVMYGNEDATDDNKQPHYSGPIDDNHRIAGWRQQTRMVRSIYPSKDQKNKVVHRHQMFHVKQ